MRRALIFVAIGLAGCFHATPPDEPVPDPAGAVHVVLEPHLAEFVVTPAHPATSATWSLLRGVEVVDAGDMAPAANGTFRAATLRPLPGASYSLRIALDGVPALARDFRVGAPAWAPARDGTWPVTLLRAGPNLTARLDGTLVAERGEWRLAANGTFRDDADGSTLYGAVSRLALAARNGSWVVEELLVVARLLGPAGEEISTSTIEKRLVGDDWKFGFRGEREPAWRHRVWSRTTGELRPATGPIPFDTTSLLVQWTAHSGEKIAWERRSWDNATGRSSFDDGFGDADDSPRFFPEWRGRVPLPTAPGDRFVLVAQGDDARIAFVAGPTPDGLRATGNASGARAGSAVLELSADGALRSYEESTTRAGISTTLRIG